MKRMIYNSFTTLLFLNSALAQNPSGQRLKCAEQYCIDLNTYKKLDVPTNPTQVSVDLDVTQILEIDDIKFTVSFAMYFGVRWLEPRIIGPSNSSENPYVPIDIKFINELWVPDVYVYFLKQINILTIFTKFAGLFVVNGNEILYSQETHITFWCPMRFDNFPLDSQICKFKVGSYAYDEAKMQFSTSLLSYDDTIRNTILDYTVVLNPLGEDDKLFVWQSIGNYSLAGYEMVLQRNSLKYLVNYYLPSGLFVLVSWVSFLIPPEIVPGRMTLLVTIFLVLINIFNNVTSNSPNVEGLTAISTWIITCILFVFGALTGYAAILYIKNRLTKQDFENNRAPKSGNWHGNELTYIDSAFVIIFPLLFVIFNCLYWPLSLLRD
ncbi:gamma-aminobutyric acid receptor subunit pi [Eurytemora carolleeae]|uniref:gamma-aminobutyric acid receptor subunit pi n=1 Tax=Eurytemora carolleeae TaxID=1294199 RepID=UPI000C75A654|nr:gamma-aminobutyric acid receptor subunit pi [Eurytemora carolleeae]|eukprot:XP_023343176.1 gamma-aminobutyric acid receptor subunit pi-like [Eurytemora affinis]